MEKLTNRDVEHVANLSRLKVSDDEIDWYASQLNYILTEIDKIDSLDDLSNDIMITSSTNINCYSPDLAGEMLSTKEVLLNAKNTRDNYITVPKVLND